MAAQSIGSVSSGQIPEDRDWIVWALKLAKRYVLRVCGEPPDGCRLDVIWNDHELGDYPTLAVSCDDNDELPWDYVETCERAFEVFDEAVDWSALKDHLAEVEEDEDDDESATDDDEPPTHITVTVEVTDREGDPVEGASVGIFTPTYVDGHEETDRLGRFAFEVPTEGAESVDVTVFVHGEHRGTHRVRDGDVLTF